MTQKNDKDKLVSLGEASTITGFSVRTLQGRILNNELQSLKNTQGHHRVRLSDINALNMIKRPRKNRAPIGNARVQVDELHKRGWPALQIARKLGITVARVYHIIDRIKQEGR